eukprot:2993093-Prymnesium_polylepis.1
MTTCGTRRPSAPCTSTLSTMAPRMNVSSLTHGCRPARSTSCLPLSRGAFLRGTGHVPYPAPARV